MLCPCVSCGSISSIWGASFSVFLFCFFLIKYALTVGTRYLEPEPAFWFIVQHFAVYSINSSKGGRQPCYGARLIFFFSKAQNIFPTDLYWYIYSSEEWSYCTYVVTQHMLEITRCVLQIISCKPPMWSGLRLVHQKLKLRKNECFVYIRVSAWRSYNYLKKIKVGCS